MTTAMQPQIAPLWQTRLQNQAHNAKTAIRTGDFLTFHVLQAVEELKFSAPSPVPSLTSSTDVSAATQDLKNLNTATVGSLNDKFGDYATDTDKLKDDPNPDKNAWQARIKANGQDLKTKADAAIDASTDQAIAKITELPAASQDGVASGFMTGRNAVFSFVDNMGKQIMNVLNNIADFFKGIWDSMVNAWNSVKNAAQDAWNTITGIFSVVSPVLRIDKGTPFKATWPQEATAAIVSTAIGKTLQLLAQRGIVASHKVVKLGPTGLSAELSLYDIGETGGDPDTATIKTKFEEALDQAAKAVGVVKPSIDV